MPRKSSAPKPKAVVRAGARRTYDDAFKFKAALEAYIGAVPLSELASKYEVHPNLISQWKATLLESGRTLFSHKTAERHELERLRHKNEALTHQIGELAIDNNFLKKFEKVEPAVRRKAVDRGGTLSLSRRCRLLSLGRTSLYYHAAGGEAVHALMRRIDELFTEDPARGVKRMCAALRKDG